MEVLEEGVPYLIESSGVNPEEIVGIGIDFTSSTVMFTDEHLESIHNLPGFENNPHAYVKL